jgi:alpha-D-ribose 1-methylphosphonate 5-triphosphate synthase subunit PhnH
MPSGQIETFALTPGFGDPERDAQAVFRAVLEAMSRPGRIVPLGAATSAPAPLPNLAAAVALALCDQDTPLWITPGFMTAAAWLKFHTGVPVVTDPARAAFAILDGANLPVELDRFPVGSALAPEDGATLIVALGALSAEPAGQGVRLTGPGIETEHRLAAKGVDPALWRHCAANAARFPAGHDLVLCAVDHLACLPRSTRVEI